MTTLKMDEAELSPPSTRWFFGGELAVDALAGAAAGASLGMLAGPPGIVAGALVGGAVGAVAAAALHVGQLERDVHTAELDHDIGVIGGNLGEARPFTPSAHLGTHAASLGIEPSSTTSEDRA